MNFADIDARRAQAEIEITQILRQLESDTFRKVDDLTFYSYSNGSWIFEIALSGDEA